MKKEVEKVQDPTYPRRDTVYVGNRRVTIDAVVQATTTLVFTRGQTGTPKEEV